MKKVIFTLITIAVMAACCQEPSNENFTVTGVPIFSYAFSNASLFSLESGKGI